jgi:hypothetical protein
MDYVNFSSIVDAKVEEVSKPPCTRVGFSSFTALIPPISN